MRTAGNRSNGAPGSFVAMARLFGHATFARAGAIGRQARRAGVRTWRNIVRAAHGHFGQGRGLPRRWADVCPRRIGGDPEERNRQHQHREGKAGHGNSSRTPHGTDPTQGPANRAIHQPLLLRNRRPCAMPAGCHAPGRRATRALPVRKPGHSRSRVRLAPRPAGASANMRSGGHRSDSPPAGGSTTENR